MGRNDPKYSDRQREAIAGAMLDRKMTAGEAARAAAAGELGVEPFEVPETTARDIAAEARRDRGPTPALSDWGQRFAERVRGLADRNLASIEKRFEGRELDSQALTKVDKLLKVAYEVERFEQAQAGVRQLPVPNGGDGGENGDGGRSQLVEQVLEAEQRRAQSNGDRQQTPA